MVAFFQCITLWGRRSDGAIIYFLVLVVLGMLYIFAFQEVSFGYFAVAMFCIILFFGVFAELFMGGNVKVGSVITAGLRLVMSAPTAIITISATIAVIKELLNERIQRIATDNGSQEGRTTCILLLI